jgi:hypothetical protein
MGHYSEDDLILYFYGEHRRARRVSAHLEMCAACAAEYRTLAGTLALVEPADPAPARGDLYGLEVWQRVRHRLPPQDGTSGFAAWFRLNGFAAATAIVVLLVAAFVAGRMWPRSEPAARTPGVNMAAGDPAERARLVAIGDHLERSERVLLDVMNAPASADALDITAEQAWAGDLLDANRLYRDAATHAGDEDIAQVLDDLERSLLEVVHGPASLSAAELEQLQGRVAAATLLFRVRVLSNELRDRVSAPTQNGTIPKNRTIS